MDFGKIIGIVCGVVFLAVIAFGYIKTQKEITEKKANGTYKVKKKRSYYKVDPERFAKLHALQEEEKKEK